MSQADVERFVEDLKNDEGMRGELQAQAAGVASVVAFAQGKGYDISAEEARTYIQSQANRDLSDEELDAVAGGKGHHGAHHGATNVQTVQTVATATTEAVAAETTVNVAAEVEVVAVAAVVLT